MSLPEQTHLTQTDPPLARAARWVGSRVAEGLVNAVVTVIVTMLLCGWHR